MKLATLNIGKRLALGYGLICAMLVLMIVMSNAMLGKINVGTDEIVHNRMPRIALTNRMQAEINDIAIALRNTMLSDDAADREKRGEDVAEDSLPRIRVPLIVACQHHHDHRNGHPGQQRQ